MKSSSLAVLVLLYCAVGELTLDQSRNQNQGRASFPFGFISTTSIGHYYTTSLEVLRIYSYDFG